MDQAELPPSQAPKGGTSRAPKKNFRGRLFSIIAASSGLLVVVMLIGGGAVLAGRVWDPSWNPFRPAPAKVVAQAFSQLGAATTLDYQATMFVALPQGINVSATLVGAVDKTDPSQAKLKGTMHTSIEGLQGFAGVQQISGQVVVIGAKAYLKTDSLSDSLSAYLADRGIRKKSLIGSWRSFPLASGALQFPVPAAQDDGSNLASSITKLPDAGGSGQTLYRYRVMVDKGWLKGSMRQMLAGTAGAEDYVKLISSWIDSAGDITADISVGSKDGNLHELFLRLSGSGGQGSADITFSNFNAPVTIAAPK